MSKSGKEDVKLCYSEFSEILIDARVRLDLKGHNGKTPLDLATEIVGSEHALAKLIQSKIEAVQV